MRNFVSLFSDSLKPLVNENLIKSRANENMVTYIDDLCKEVKKLIGEDVEYLGYEANDRITQVQDLNKVKQKGKKNFSGAVISTETTYARAYNFNFRLSFKGEVRKVFMTIYVPLLSEDGVNYIIKGNKYCTPYQLIDAVTYNRTDSKNRYDEVCLRTSVRDIKMQRFKTNVRDIYGNNYNVNYFNIKLNAKVNKVPFVLFYFASFGFIKTLEYFGLSSPIVGTKIFTELPEDPEDPYYKYYHFFKFGNVYLSVRKSVFANNNQVRDILATILSIGKKRSISIDNIIRVEYWLTLLGSHLSINNSLTSGYSLRATFINSLDPKTSELINTFIGKKNLYSMFAVVRWMFNDYSINVSKDSSLINKRLRLSEYVIDPLKQLLKKKCYQYSGSRGGFRDIRRLEDVFKVSKTILLDNIIGKNNSSLNTGKFSNAVNDFAILTSISKASQTGPGVGSGMKSSFIPKDFKRLHQSMIGRVDLISSSVNNPGATLSLLPNCQIDIDTLGFNKLTIPNK